MGGPEGEQGRGFPTPGLKGPFLCLLHHLNTPTPAPSSALLVALAPILPHISMKVLLEFLWDFSDPKLMVRERVSEQVRERGPLSPEYQF